MNMMMSKIQQQQQPNSFIPGNAPTSVPAEYSITFDSINIPKDLMSLKNQPQAFVSHDEDFQLWNENEIVTHSMEKFVMTGATKALKQELSDAFMSGLITDFIVTHGLLSEEQPSTMEEKLVLQGENPYVSFVGRLGNLTSLLFTGLSGVKFCSSYSSVSGGGGGGGEEYNTNSTRTSGDTTTTTTNTTSDTGGKHSKHGGDNTTDIMSKTEGITTTEDECEVWYDEMSWPLYVYTVMTVNMSSNEDNTTSKNEVFGKVIEMVDPIGIVKFDLVHSENTTSDAMNIIEEHKQQIQKNKLMSICIIIALIIIALFLTFKAWMAKYRDYESL